MKLKDLFLYAGAFLLGLIAVLFFTGCSKEVVVKPVLGLEIPASKTATRAPATATAAAGPIYLTFDCTPAADEVTSAKLQFNSDAPVNAPLVSTCGSDPATKVTCTDTLSKTICYPDSLWPTGSFTVKAQVSNSRDTSAYSAPLSVPTGPGFPSSLRQVR